MSYSSLTKCVVPLVAVVLLAPAVADAQFVTYRPIYGSGFSRPYWSGGGWGGVPGYGGFPTFGGFPSGIYGGGYSPGMSYYNPGWGYPFSVNPMEYSQPLVLPGFTASDPPRTRASLYPAIPQPTRDKIIAVLGEAADDTRAYLEIRVPTKDAKVYLDDVLTQQTGIDRTFVTPKLAPNSTYYFQLRVTWRDRNGIDRIAVRTIEVQAGRTARLDLLSAYQF